VDKNKHFNFSTLTLIVLKEIRHSRALTQAFLADRTKKVASAVNKIESGQTALSMDTFLQFCRAFEIMPSNVIKTAEGQLAVLYSNEEQADGTHSPH
jgi:transcriptional regulator with XRE-family HTH domain